MVVDAIPNEWQGPFPRRMVFPFQDPLERERGENRLCDIPRLFLNPVGFAVIDDYS